MRRGGNATPGLLLSCVQTRMSRRNRRKLTPCLLLSLRPPPLAPPSLPFRSHAPVQIENIAVGHPKVAEAAVVGVVHPKWGERPLLIVVRALIYSSLGSCLAPPTRPLDVDRGSRLCSAASPACVANAGAQLPSSSAALPPRRAAFKLVNLCRCFCVSP